MSQLASAFELADVVRLLAHASEHTVAQWIALLGVERQPDPAREHVILPTTQAHTAVPPRVDPPQPQPAPESSHSTPLQISPFAVVRAEPLVPSSQLQAAPVVDISPEDRPMAYGPFVAAPAPAVLLQATTRWWPVLHSQSAPRLRAIDTDRWTRQSALARWPQHPPRRTGMGAWRHCLVLVDVSHHQTPFQPDFAALLREMRQRKLAECLDVRWLSSGPTPIVWPQGVDAVFVLSDLGASAPDPHAYAQQWLACLHEARRQNLPIMAWVPASASRISRSVLSSMQVTAWHEGSDLRPVKPAQTLAVNKLPPALDVSPLLPYLSMVLFAEPAVLRRLRRLCVKGRQHPEWEAWLWAERHPHAVAGQCVMQMPITQTPAWRERFAQLSADKQRSFYQTITAQHQHRQRSTLLAERLLFQTYAQADFQTELQHEFKDAQAWFGQMQAQVQAQRQQMAGPDVQTSQHPHHEFLQDMVQRLQADSVWVEHNQHLISALGAACDLRPRHVSEQEWLRASGAHLRAVAPLIPWGVVCEYLHGQATFAVLPQPPAVGHVSTPPVQWVSPVGKWRHIAWDFPMQASRSGSTTAPDRWRAQPNVVSLVDELGLQRLHLATVPRPTWALRWGHDAYGLFADLGTKTPKNNIPQRLRYIPPGTFLMGSPGGVGLSDEHPQHPVTFSEGFWLADTPCTQALWQAVMGGNPSHFGEGPDAQRRPVESVAFDDPKAPEASVNVFLQRLQALLPAGVQAGLPTEAQWEYACRAGTSTTYWWGDEWDDRRGNVNEKNKSTTPVGMYPPNPWGLHDMHGNVWEWCVDAGLRDYAAQAETDPVGQIDGDRHVLRGGSWFEHSDWARSASRSVWHVDWRLLEGFRLLLRSSSTSQQRQYTSRPEGGA